MKKQLSIICLAATLLAPVDSSAYYEIELVNGSRLLTSEHWLEGKETKFTYVNGVVGVNSSDILRISERSGALKKPSPPNKGAAEKIVTSIQSGEDPLLDDFSRLQEKFTMVTVMDEKDLYGLARELTDFRNTVLKVRKGSAYSSQIEEVYAMFDTIEAQLKENH